ncbi:MAG: NAD(P)-dependent oxidoreductase [Prevotella sp.]|jgi:glutamate synthase (NADPH/NADH) small chain|nr:NAD(P)-dependent oxidoreductase [Prevotella sp.]
MRFKEEINESYTMAEAIKEAQRCLHCKVPQCKKGCPISNDIPDWIHELKKGNLGNAISIIRAKSNLPAVCGRVCAHEKQCEGSCVLGKKGQPVNIGKLERFVADFDSDNELTHEDIAEKTRGKVAVIGAGPSGITVAGDLAREGFTVEIFEMEAQCGGVLRYGIPEYRLPKEVVAREIRYIEKMGVVIHRNTHVGVEITVDSLFEQGFDAVFIGTGLSKPKSLEIPIWKNGSCISEGEGATTCKDLKRIRLATHFLRRVELISEGFMQRDELPVDTGARVFVIGCGNTAMDASRTALRIGASQVEIVYHKGIDTMSALHAEYDDAVKEGVRFNWWSSITEIHVDDNLDITEIVLETKEPDKEPVRQTLPANNIIFAIGATPATKIVRTTSGLENDDKKFLITREVPYGMTTRKGVFAGGDVVGRQATVVHAMQDAKKVAQGIAQYVDAVKLMKMINM